MSKAETLRQSAAEKNKTSLEQLAGQVQMIRDAKAQSVEELSAMLEPLAQALASLGSQAAQTLSEIEQKTRTAGVDFERQVTAANDSLATVVQATRQSTRELNRAANRLDWSHFALVIATGLLSALLVSGFWLWLSPPTVQNPLDPKAVAESLKPAVIEALKNAKEAKPAKGK